MIYVGENKSVICKGDFHPAALYKGDKKIAGYTRTDFSGEGGVTLDKCYNDRLHDTQISGNSVQDGTPSPDAPIEIQSVGELVAEGDYAGKYKVSVTARGNNLFDKDNYVVCSKWNTVNIVSTETGLSWIHNGASSHNSGFLRIRIGLASDYAGKTLTLSWSGHTNRYTQIVVYDSVNNKVTAISNQYIKEDGYYYTTATIGEGYTTEYLAIRLYCSHLDTSINYDNIMLCESSEYVPYEPYIEPQTFDIYLDKPLRKLGDYADYIDFEKSVYVQKISVPIIKNLTWSKMSDFTATDGTVLYRYETNYLSKRYFTGDGKYSAKGDLLCNALENVAYTTMRDNSISERVDTASYGTGRQIRILTSVYSTVAEMRAAFGDFEIHCILENPIEESIDLPELPTFKGTTIYEINTSITAGIAGNYKKQEE